ncbi:transcriptional regulator [Bacteroidia bacterium]|nr:transcriptional regulator [Bacteroidia bacterium]
MPRSIAHWYVARVQYQTAGKIRNFIETNGAECYIALQEERQVLPGILFIRTDYDRALSLSEACGNKITYLRDSATGKFQIIPDKEMADFRFLQDFADKTIILPNPEKLQGGEKVRIVKGEFTGIEGEIYRIRGHKRVVVRLGELGAVAMEYVARECLERVG